MTRRRNIRAKVLARDGKVCRQCGKDVSAPAETGFKSARKDSAEVDHRVPLALGGDDDPAQCEVLCRLCHKRKTKQDVRAIAKARRVGKRQDELRARMDEKAGRA